MQNIVKETLQAGQSIRTGGAKYLLMRDASNSVTVQLDTFEPVEIKKNDVVIIEGCTTVIFKNHHTNATTIEYQITDIAINTQSDAVAINGAVNVNEITKPVVISAIQGDVAISNFPATQSVTVENLSDMATSESKSIMTALPDMVITATEKVIPSKSDRKAILVQCPPSNKEAVIVGGFWRIYPSSFATIPASNALTVSGVVGDVMYMGEVFNA